MAVLYTPEQIESALVQLKIAPEDGMVTGQEAARILTWRAKKERSVKHEYSIIAVRKQAAKLGAVKKNTQLNLYPVEAVFRLSIEPKRGRQPKNMEKAKQKDVA